MAQSNRIIEHYKEMKEELEELHLANLSKRDVANIIEEFQHNINSVRVARLITDLKGVISILEARKTLLPENPWALEKIAQIVDRPYGQERINEYKRYLKATTLLYEQRHQEPNVEFNCKPRLIDIGIFLIFILQLKRICQLIFCFSYLVFEEISQHLVNDWRMFARCLELKENEICQIENSSRGKEKAAIQVLV